MKVCKGHFISGMLYAAQVIHLLCSRSILKHKILSFTVLQRVLQMDVDAISHKFTYTDEARFHLTKSRRRGRNIIGHRAIIDVSGQLGSNIILCAAITQNAILLPHANTGPYNTPHILTFVGQLHNIITVNQMCHSTMLHRSTTGFTSILNLLCYTFQHTLYFLYLLYRFFPQ